MNQNPLVSIVLCVYNGEAFLQQQIDSILGQTYKKFELLILNDNSSDLSNELIEQYLRKDSRIRYFRNETNLGFNRNFEKGFRLSEGELIAISDQDDIWLSNKIEQLVLNLGEHMLIYSNSELINAAGTRLNERLDSNVIHLDNPTFKSFLNDNFITGHTCLFKKELLNYALPFPEGTYFYDWWLGFTASYGGKIKYLDKVLTLYRIHDKSVMQELTVEANRKRNRDDKKYLQLKEFSIASFLQPDDREFIQKFLDYKRNAKKGILSFIRCYNYLLKNHQEIYPWYKKSLLKKLNFLRKQCLQA